MENNNFEKEVMVLEKDDVFPCQNCGKNIYRINTNIRAGQKQSEGDIIKIENNEPLKMGEAMFCFFCNKKVNNQDLLNLDNYIRNNK